MALAIMIWLIVGLICSLYLAYYDLAVEKVDVSRCWKQYVIATIIGTLGGIITMVIMIGILHKEIKNCETRGLV